MADLDVSDVLDDEDFVDTFSVIRTTEVVSQRGRASAGTTTTIPDIVGSVQPNTGRSLQRLDAGERLTDAITIYTRYRLNAGSGAQGEADQVLWNGGTYVVRNVRDFSRFGAGYVEAVCDLTSINPALVSG